MYQLGLQLSSPTTPFGGDVVSFSPRLSVVNNGDGTATWTIRNYTHPDSGGSVRIYAGTTPGGSDLSPSDEAYNATSGIFEVNDNTTPYYFRYSALDDLSDEITHFDFGPITITGDTNASVWIALQEAASYAFSTQERNAVHTAMSEIRNNGLLDHICLLQPFFMGSAARNNIPLIKSIAGSQSLGSNVTHPGKHIRYNGSAGSPSQSHYRTGFVPSTDGWTLNNIAFGYYLSEAVTASGHLQGVSTSTNGTIQESTGLTSVGSFVDFGNSSNRTVNATTNGAVGLRSVTKTSATNGAITLYNGTQTVIVSRTNLNNAHLTIPPAEFAFGARNTSGTFYNATDHKHGLAWMACNGFTTTDRDVLEIILYNLLDGFGAL
jgi:hypothetical protein